jgi:hypothetical protein
MKVIARGYATHNPRDLAVVSQLVITPEQAENHEGLRYGLWWEFEYVPSLWDRLVARIPASPTRASRIVGALLVTLALLAVLAVAGAVEGKADTHRYTERSLFASEWQVWRSLSIKDQDAYCGMYRGYAEYVWLDGMSEGASWDAPPRMQEKVAQRVLSRGCGVWVR